MRAQDSLSEHSLYLEQDWDVLGPFQIGTREVVWGSDPLEQHGGFRHLQYDTSVSFHSSLSPLGKTGWTKVKAPPTYKGNDQVSAEVFAEFSDVNWNSLQSVYGWPALQYQAWARGIVHCKGENDINVLLHMLGIVEFWVDEEHYFGGDLYSFGRTPVKLRLRPGLHSLHVRYVNDLRAMGAIEKGIMRFCVDVSIPMEPVRLAHERVVVADIVNDVLVSDLCSIPVVNCLEHAIDVVQVRGLSHNVVTDMLDGSFVRLMSGQTRPVPFRLRLRPGHPMDIELDICYKVKHADPEQCKDNLKMFSFSVTLSLRTKSISEPHKITYRHSGGIVSYALLRPPSKKAVQESSLNKEFPVFLNLHGAGLEADSEDLARTLDHVPDLPAWTLFPSGVTPWSGDDWHQWGMADVLCAIAAIPQWIKQVGWDGPLANTSRWFVSGHSNGGQGVYYMLSHRPDNIIAAACVSGYSSIQQYIPYQMWREVDPGLTAVIQSTLNNYRHELLVPTSARGIPVIQQHGDEDGNVPVFHSRRMSQLLIEDGTDTKYFELNGKDHWFEGIMTTPELKQFYYEKLHNSIDKIHKLDSFTLVVANPGEHGPKNGISIDQLFDPGQLGKIKVSTQGKSVLFKTSNVLRMAISEPFPRQSHFEIDGQSVSYDQLLKDERLVLEKVDRRWQAIFLSKDRDHACQERHKSQSYTMNAILSTQGKFTIVFQHAAVARVALQISRNLHQYFGADAELLCGNTEGADARGNMIRLYVGDEQVHCSKEGFPLEIGGSKVSVKDSSNQTRQYCDEGSGLGAVFLQPLSHGRLELTVWGNNVQNLACSSRLVPTITGAGQPDFVVLTSESLKSGLAATLAAGYFDTFWKTSRTSYFT